MTNPVLKKLSRPGLTRVEIAELLEKHIGSCSNEWHCQEALDALRRIKEEGVKVPVLVAIRLTEDGSRSCVVMRRVIEQIRGLPDELANPSQD